jgi:hypothetical protein
MVRNVQNVMVKARLHKSGGPAGGGYGLIIRDLSVEPLDGTRQSGQY